MICKLAYSEPVLSPEIEKVPTGTASGVKILLGAWMGLLLLSFVWLLQAGE